ncbi:non-ribosomal peptide synthetase [Ktedonobacter robiniae]|uniref:Non-ribosomal peptide synthetase n=1 Tax=Ktedonobacter robiniae TaxID=2778365 RepID=A0ABQ3V5C8_9CHLR|nr:AMP-binding protein [Ktedonobacter robiniae]GHO60123.1 hypothetical protein KSB_85980 [Ktedonobacter robiniae]
MQATSFKGFNLSIQQARLWTLQGESQAYLSLCAARLEGTLDMMLFLRAFQSLIEQHTILRTTFYCLPDMDIPLQVVIDDARINCPVLDLSNLALDAQQIQIDACFSHLQTCPTDLTQLSLLLRTGLLRLSTDNHVLLFCLPALCADDMTLSQCIVELSRMYAVLSAGEPLDEDPLQYADVSAWQDDLLAREDAEQQREYWRAQDFSRLVTTQDLCISYSTHGETSSLAQISTAFSPQAISIPLEPSLYPRLQTLANQYGISLEACLLACWQMTLWHLTNEAHFMLGVAQHGRVDEELLNILGLYTRFAPVESMLAANLPFEQIATLSHRALEQTFEEQLYFTWQIVEEHFKGGNNVPPLALFPICFEYTEWAERVEAGDLAISLYKRYSCTEPFIMKLYALRQAASLGLELQYDLTYLSREQARRIGLMFQTILSGVVVEPRQVLARLSLLPAPAQEALLQASRGQELNVEQTSFIQSFEEQVVLFPAQPAVISVAQQLTYDELNRRANQLAHTLRKWGVGPNTLVALSMTRSVEMITALLAIWKAGGAYVPLDIESPAGRLIYQLQDTRVSLLLTQETLQSQLPAWQGETLCLEALEEEIRRAPQGNPAPVADAGDLAYIIYTSGSTGQPKGVMVTQRNVVNYTRALSRVIQGRAGWHYATVSTLAADLGNTAIFCSLASGGCLHILDYETVTSSEAFARWMVQHPIDVLKIVPSHLSALLVGENASSVLPREVLILGGEAFPTSLLERLKALGARCCIVNHYGPTESTIGVLTNRLADDASSQRHAAIIPLLQDPQTDRGRDPQAQQSLSASSRYPQEEYNRGKPNTSSVIALGRPIANIETYVLGPGLQLVPPGVVGELYIGGAGLATGYLRQAWQTAERFIPHPFSERPGARLYRTGDLARYTSQGRLSSLGDAITRLRYAAIVLS